MIKMTEILYKTNIHNKNNGLKRRFMSYRKYYVNIINSGGGINRNKGIKWSIPDYCLSLSIQGPGVWVGDQIGGKHA